MGTGAETRSVDDQVGQAAAEGDRSSNGATIDQELDHTGGDGAGGIVGGNLNGGGDGAGADCAGWGSGRQGRTS